MTTGTGPTAAPGGPPGRLPSLTGLRAVFAYCVLLCHTSSNSGFFEGGLGQLLFSTQLIAGPAVGGFFVLSGYVLTWAHTAGDRPRAFWRRRFWKIFPNHAVAWSAVIGLFLVTGRPTPVVGVPGDQDAADALLGLFLLQSWAPDPEVYFSFNAPAWSISCEAFFYLLFPLLITRAVRLPRTALRAVWPALAMLIAALPTVALVFTGPPMDWLPVSPTAFWFVHAFPAVRIAEFALGAVTARLVLRNAFPAVPRWLTGLLVVAAVAVVPLLPMTYAAGSLCAVPLALLIGALATADAEGRSTVLARPVPVRLGEASFALYLVHLPVLLLVRELIGAHTVLPVWGAAVATAICTALAQGVAFLMHRAVEVPLQQRWARPRRVSLTVKQPKSRQ
ncbi:acyltransferase family protein [Streptomyces sp. NPDC094448]|uniref:acyltransferase family protein n=1 Tax=Streptomyces sp. NPDC094448 TaxID=3366063 RepID=UPI00381ADBC6